MKTKKVIKPGKDLRSAGDVDQTVRSVETATDFLMLFSKLYDKDRKVVMHVADAIEKLSATHPEWLQPVAGDILHFLRRAEHKEFRWHLAQLTGRVQWTRLELKEVWEILSAWVEAPNESKIVRVFSLQAMFDLSVNYPDLRSEFLLITNRLADDPAPSVQSRLKKLKKNL